MTTIDPHAVGTTGAGITAAAGDRSDAGESTVASWVTTTDHKRIGRLFIVDSLLTLVAVAVIGAILGFERIDAKSSTLDFDALPQLFSLYRVALTFGVVVPLGLGLAITIVPLQLGARALAFSRMAALGFWAWLMGVGLMVGAIIANGGPGGGDSDMVDLFLVGHVLMVLGLIAAAASVAASVLTTRAPGMNMRRVPLFAWSALVGSLGLVLMLPVLAGTLILITIDHRYRRSIFGGNDGIFDWIGFAYTQPATFLYAVPVFGMVAETVATATGRRLRMRGLALIGAALVGSAFLAGVTQVDAGVRRNVIDSNFSDALGDIVPFAILNLLPLLGALAVLAVVMFAALGRPRIISPLLFSFFGAAMVLVGMLGNVVYHIGDAQLAGTVFEEATWVYVCYGTVLAAMGGIAYWTPKLSGRTLPDAQVLPLALLGLAATVLASFPYYIAGFAKQPAGVTEFDYSGPQELWNMLAAIGHGLMALTVVAFVGLVVQSMRRGGVAGDDPWDGQTLEWATTSPAPANNFAEIHIIKSAAPLLDLKPERAPRRARGQKQGRAQADSSASTASTGARPKQGDS